MTEGYLIGVDIGTQGTKTTLFSIEGNAVAESFEPSRLISPSPGVVEQEPDEILGSVYRTIRKVMEQSGVNAGKVEAVGMDGQMAGILGIDRDWNAVTCYDSWLDTRCGWYIRQIKEQAEEEVIKTTGCPVTYAHGPKVLWWKHERPDSYRKISRFVLPTTYVAGKMTGLKAEEAYIDYTHLHFSGFGDVQKNRWAEDLLNHFGVEREKMPEIVEPWKIVGCLTEEAAGQCGLTSGIPVAAGCGDQAATSLGAGVTRAGLAFDVAGTASVFSCCVSSYTPDVKYKTLLYPRSVLPGLWIPLAYTNGGGLCLKWFRDNLTGKGTPPSYRELDAEAEAVPAGSENLLFLPHFAGRVCPNDPDVRGTWVGLNWSHTRGHLYRAVMEGIAYEYKYYLRVLSESMGKVDFTGVIAAGGGAKSRVFNAIKSDVLGIPYVTMKRNDTATFGSAVVAGYGAGIYTDMVSVIEKVNEKTGTVMPNEANAAVYGRLADAYEGVFQALGPTFRRLAEER